ncbi:MAG: cob(I)yrinic acid a,c-diamide adenosyltransferase [Eubacterium sp.]|nr:cob(I)yrinic acid a,c-diamide adenosyltransferase [Eubacterium sp.]
MEKGVIQAFYGDGKGKTSAALGQALRDFKEGSRVTIIQFLKGKEPGEFQILEKLEPDVSIFHFDQSQVNYIELSLEEREREKQNIINGVNFAHKVIETGESDIIVLDELLGLVDLGILSNQDLIDLLQIQGDYKRMYITGTNLDQSLVPYLDEICKISQEKDRT